MDARSLKAIQKLLADAEAVYAPYLSKKGAEQEGKSWGETLKDMEALRKSANTVRKMLEQS